MKTEFIQEREAMFRTGIAGFEIRFAMEEDCELILQMIRELADYEKLGHEVTATVNILKESLFEKKQAEVLIGEANGSPAAFALFFHNFSTFLGKAGLYLEDLYVRESCRGNGYGKAMLQCLACMALIRGCERLDWWCLDWNRSAIDFYQKMGAQAMSDWTVYRLQGEALVKLSDAFGNQVGLPGDLPSISGLFPD